jgi:formylmethanofuran dehydrogenase subunit D
MKEIEVTLLSGRTTKQGIGLEEGKTSDSYEKSVNLIFLNQVDVETLELTQGQPVKITTEEGSTQMNWVTDKNLDSGLAFIPYGPWANQLYSSKTSGTGMPRFKGIKAKVTQTHEKVPSLLEIIESLRRKK